jgi:hypothetical protein
MTGVIGVIEEGGASSDHEERTRIYTPRKVESNRGRIG